MKRSHTIPLALNAEEAKKIAQQAWDQYGSQFKSANPTFAWNKANPSQADITFMVGSTKVQGSLTIIHEKSVVFEVDLPFALVPFFEPAKKAIEGAVKELLSKNPSPAPKSP